MALKGQGGESKLVAIAGASGTLGREVIRALAQRGHRARALIRDPGKRELVGEAEQVQLIDLLGPDAALEEALEGVDVVFSAAGQSSAMGRRGERQSFQDVDYPINKALLDAALAVGATQFVCVSVLNGPELRHLAYVDAHERVVDDAIASGIDCTVVRANAFFSVYLEALAQARRGSLLGFGDPKALSNPIDERDLATACVEALDRKQASIDVGGPEILTRREELEAAFLALGREPRVRWLPTRVAKAALPVLRLRDRRRAEMLEFVLSIATRDMLATPCGSGRLQDYLREKAAF
jgi:uncharacterized protein YbjT (DUF2867 family)